MAKKCFFGSFDDNDDSDDDNGRKESIGACSPQEGSKWSTGIINFFSGLLGIMG